MQRRMGLKGVPGRRATRPRHHQTKRAGQPEPEPASQPTIGTQPVRLDLKPPVHPLSVLVDNRYPFLRGYDYVRAGPPASRSCDWQSGEWQRNWIGKFWIVQAGPWTLRIPVNARGVTLEEGDARTPAALERPEPDLRKRQPHPHHPASTLCSLDTYSI